MGTPISLAMASAMPPLAVPPSRVNEQNVHTISLCRFDRVVGHGGRVRAALPGYYLRSRPLAPPLELLYGRRPKGIPGGEHRLARQEIDQLADRGRLPRAVHADHEDHGGIVRHVELHRSLEHPRRVLYEQRPELLAAREVLLQRLLLELPHELGRGRDADVGGDEDLLDPLPELLVLSVPKLRHSRVELPDDGLPAPAEPLAEPPEPAASLLYLHRSLGIGRLLNHTRFRERLLDLARLRFLHRSLDDLGLPPLGQHLFGRRHLVLGGRSPVTVRSLGLRRHAGLRRLFTVPLEKITPRARHELLPYSPCMRFDTTVVAPAASWTTP